MATTATMSAAIKLSLPVGLAVLYVVAALIWYELLRSELLDLLGRRKRRRQRKRRRRVRSGETGVAGEDARVHYDLARKAAAAERDAAVEAANAATRQAIERIEQRYGQTPSAMEGVGMEAKAERDAAVAAANAAAKQAIERIGQRYREIDWALEDEEAERIRQMLEQAER